MSLIKAKFLQAKTDAQVCRLDVQKCAVSTMLVDQYTDTACPTCPANHHYDM
jgi:hypothetical protein